LSGNLRFKGTAPVPSKITAFSVRSFLQVAEKRFDQSDELNENEIEKYVYRKIRKDHISSSYQRFANVLFCAWTIFIFLFLSL